MLRISLIFGTLCFFLCSSVGDDVKRVSKREDTNDYVDKVLANARDLIQEHNYDPYHLPDFQLNFPVKIIFQLNGRLEAWNVQVHGLSTIHRNGDARTIDHPDYVAMSIGLGVNNLLYDGRTRFSAGIFKFTFELSLTADLVTARANIHFPIDTGKPQVSEFDIDYVGNIKANNRNWGMFNWLADLILNNVLNRMKDTIRTQIRQPIIDTLNEIVEKIPMK